MTTAPAVAPMLNDIINEEWRRALTAHAGANGVAALLTLPLNSHVGKCCQALVEGVEALRPLDMETDDLTDIISAASHTMGIWYFG
jgi:hypothetical protein